VRAFLDRESDAIVGAVNRSMASRIEGAQTSAWHSQVLVMKDVLSRLGMDGLIAFEFAVPRMGKRVDVLVVVGGAVFVLEFKVGERRFTSEAVRQVWDYALDMKNFHSSSHGVPVVPVLIATEAEAHPTDGGLVRRDADGTVRPIKATPASLAGVLRGVLEELGGTIELEAWASGTYRPTPTIVEAAVALYAGHRVEEISRREADAVNLTRTAATVDDVIREAREQGRKAICFVTGVPGAGKTLVGLNVATKYQDKNSALHSVFLSGNGPLVKVLREALARDRVARAAAAGNAERLGKARSEVGAFIQNVHHFRDQCIRDDPAAPAEHVAIFDEAQRAWNQEQTSKFMKQKKGIADFARSEPSFLISCMDRHRDWAAIVCLVGGGQEINTGEAGIEEWIEAVRSEFPDWSVYMSPHLRDSEYAAGDAIKMLEGHAHVHTHESLHLGVSMRSFRAEHVSGWVKAALDMDREGAARAMEAVRSRYPIAVTRSLEHGRHWVREKAKGSERCGLVVSSQAQRLKPLAIDVRVDIDPVHWFLGPEDDVRSSNYLEDAATEFGVQGLELDWACVVWDGDFRYTSEGWQHWSFKGSKWQRVKQAERQKYLKNAYRVLLTRARQGMVIVVPEGDALDPTRRPEMYDETYEYLCGLGAEVVG
jgi:hypothetical protein